MGKMDGDRSIKSYFFPLIFLSRQIKLDLGSQIALKCSAFIGITPMSECESLAAQV